MLWDTFQQWKIEENKRKVEAIEQNQRDTKDASEDCAEKVRQLALATQAVWSFLKEKHHLDEQDLMQRMEEIDLLDGTKDGKFAAQTVTCLSCSRKMNSKNMKCIYCGATNQKFNPFAD